MKISEFEKITRQRLLSEGVDFDLHRNWASMEDRLEVEMPQDRGKKRRFLWLLLPGLLTCAYLFSEAEKHVSVDESSYMSLSETVTLDERIIEPVVTMGSDDSEVFTSGVAKEVTIVPSYVDFRTAGNHAQAVANKVAVKRKDLLVSEWKSRQQVPVQHLGPTPQINAVTVDQNGKSGIRVDGRPGLLKKLPIRAKNLVETTTVTSTPSLSRSPIKIARSPIGSRWNLRFSSGAMYQVNPYYTETVELLGMAEAMNNHLSNLESVHSSVIISYPLGTVSIATGILYQRLKEVLKLERITQIERQVENAIVEIRVNPLTQDSTFVHGSVTQQGQSYQSIRHYNSMNIWSVPLQFEYLSRHDRWGFGLASGLLFSISQSKKGRFLQLDGSVSGVETRHPKSIHYLTIEPIISLKLGSPFSIEARPRFQKALGSNTEVHSILRKQALFGLDLSIRYHPAKN